MKFNFLPKVTIPKTITVDALTVDTQECREREKIRYQNGFCQGRARLTEVIIILFG